MNHFAVFGANKNVFLFRFVLQTLLDAGFAKEVAAVGNESGRVVRGGFSVEYCWLQIMQLSYFYIE